MGSSATAARRIRIIGIGSGDPEQLTAEAADALAGVDYVIAAAKSLEDPLLDVRQALCDRYGVALVAVADPERDRADPADYPGAVRDWHGARVHAYEQVLLERPGDVAFLVWGDPAFYDSTLRIVEELGRRSAVAFEYDVLPGVSSPQLLAARHRMVLHQVGQPILVTTGRRLADAVTAGHDNIVVMLDGDLACLDLPQHVDWQIWWGANLGSTHEQLIAGPLAEVAAELRRCRTAVKDRAGWVMDTYLLRRVEAAPVP
jgi:precorrin-6A synthase